MLELLREDEQMVVWWATAVECHSALARLSREQPDQAAGRQAEKILATLATAWAEMEPSEAVRRAAMRLLRVHHLRAADALQLAAALVWAQMDPDGYDFLCFDNRLRHAAQLEGFSVLPLDSSA